MGYDNGGKVSSSDNSNRKAEVSLSRRVYTYVSDEF